MSLAGFKASNHPQQTSKRGAVDAVDDRGTDQAFFDSLSERFGGFTLDVAAATHNAKCDAYYTAETDGLGMPWTGRVWCNPPYSDCGAWVRKAWAEWNTFSGGADGHFPWCGGGHGYLACPPPGSDAYSRDERGLDLIVMLLPANRVEQAWWQDHVEPFRDRPDSPLRVEFLRGRMRFDRPGWTKPTKGDRPPFGCCLLIWGPR